jgi:hypothetical protein
MMEKSALAGEGGGARPPPQSNYNHVQSCSARPLSGAQSIMMKKLAQACEDGGARLPTFTITTITYNVLVYAPAERG